MFHLFVFISMAAEKNTFLGEEDGVIFRYRLLVIIGHRDFAFGRAVVLLGIQLARTHQSQP